MSHPLRDDAWACRVTAGVRAGDGQALTELYEAYFDEVCATARRCARRDEAFGMDVAQDVFLKCIRAMQPIGTTAQLSAWMRTVTVRCTRDRLREAVRRLQREAAVTGAREAARPAVPTRASDADELQRLKVALAELDSGDQWLLLRRFVHGLSLKTVGAAVGLTTGAADGRIGRAVRRLRDRLNEEASDE